MSPPNHSSMSQCPADASGGVRPALPLVTLGFTCTPCCIRSNVRPLAVRTGEPVGHVVQLFVLGIRRTGLAPRRWLPVGSGRPGLHPPMIVRTPNQPPHTRSGAHSGAAAYRLPARRESLPSVSHQRLLAGAVESEAAAVVIVSILSLDCQPDP